MPTSCRSGLPDEPLYFSCVGSLPNDWWVAGFCAESHGPPWKSEENFRKEKEKKNDGDSRKKTRKKLTGIMCAEVSS